MDAARRVDTRPVAPAHGGADRGAARRDRAVVDARSARRRARLRAAATATRAPDTELRLVRPPHRTGRRMGCQHRARDRLGSYHRRRRRRGAPVRRRPHELDGTHGARGRPARGVRSSGRVGARPGGARRSERCCGGATTPECRGAAGRVVRCGAMGRLGLAGRAARRLVAGLGELRARRPRHRHARSAAPLRRSRSGFAGDRRAVGVRGPPTGRRRRSNGDCPSPRRSGSTGPPTSLRFGTS